MTSRIVQYRCIGEVRGWCHYKYRSYAAAERCLDRDRRECARTGGHSDRVIIGFNEHGQRVKIAEDGNAAGGKS